MKIYLAVALLFAAVVNCRSQFSLNEDVQKTIKDCLVEAKLPTELENIQAQNPMGLLSNPKFKCLSACMMRKKGNIKNGKIDSEQQLSELQKESPEAYGMLKDMVTMCANIANKNDDECEVADSYVKCIIRNISIY